MRARSRLLVAALMSVALVVVFAGSVRAGEGATSNYVDGSLHKLGRGIANVATCVGEIPRVASLVGRKDGYVAAATVGLFEGFWRTILRAVAGVYEIATFPVEIPDGFEPLIKPEFVFAQGDWVE